MVAVSTVPATEAVEIVFSDASALPQVLVTAPEGKLSRSSCLEHQRSMLDSEIFLHMEAMKNIVNLFWHSRRFLRTRER